MTGPNFLIVGAPKCGTSTLYHWLEARSDIYMPRSTGSRYWRHKEPYFFCPDLVDTPQRMESAEYQEIFAPSTEYSLRGEASPFYLFSDVAPEMIREADPATKIIICLRHPAEFILSKWRDALYWGHDEELDFEKAIDADRPLSDLPARCWYPKTCQYRRVAHFSQFLPQFTERFSPEQILYVWLDELKSAPRESLDRVLAFLGAAPVEGNADLSAHNVSSGVRRTILTERALRWRMERSKLGRQAYPLVEKAFGLFYKDDVSKDIPPQVLIDLKAEFDAEYLKLMEMTERSAA